MIASRRLRPILALRERAEDAAERAHAERVRALGAAEAIKTFYARQEDATWSRLATITGGVTTGGQLGLLASLQGATRRRVIAAAADAYDAERAADESRVELVRAMQERRTIERLYERAQSAERLAELRSEQATLDELATLGHAWRDRPS